MSSLTAALWRKPILTRPALATAFKVQLTDRPQGRALQAASKLFDPGFDLVQRFGDVVHRVGERQADVISACVAEGRPGDGCDAQLLQPRVLHVLR